VKTTPVGGTAIVPNDKAIEAVERNYGYFALLSNGIKDPLEALDIYRNKDLTEKALGNLKKRLNMRRTTVSSEENLDGKLFVQFVSLIHRYSFPGVQDTCSLKDCCFFPRLHKRVTCQLSNETVDSPSSFIGLGWFSRADCYSIGQRVACSAYLANSRPP